MPGTAIDPAVLTPKQLLQGLYSMFAQFRTNYNVRVKQKIPQPRTMFLTSGSYACFVAAMRVVNGRLGIPAPAGELYTFNGVEIRCGNGDG
jgi:hypothetical protein